MEFRQATQLFHLLFQFYLFATLIQPMFFFHWLLLQSILVYKILKPLDKSYQFGQSIILFQNDPLRIFKIHIIFVPIEEPQITIFNSCQLMNFMCRLIDFFSVSKFRSNQFYHFDIMSEILSYVSIIKLGMKFVEIYRDFWAFC